MSVQGKTVLVHTDGNSWRVDNSELQASSAGLNYRQSKRFDDKLEILATWGRLVNGTSNGDGWLQTEVIHGDLCKKATPARHATDDDEPHVFAAERTWAGVLKEGIDHMDSDQYWDTSQGWELVPRPPPPVRVKRGIDAPSEVPQQLETRPMTPASSSLGSTVRSMGTADYWQAMGADADDLSGKESAPSVFWSSEGDDPDD